MDGMNPPAIHAFEHHQMPARIRHCDRNGDAGGLRALHRDGGHVLGAVVSESLCGGEGHNFARWAFFLGFFFRGWEGWGGTAPPIPPNHRPIHTTHPYT